MNKQFLSVLLLTCFATSVSAAAPLRLFLSNLLGSEARMTFGAMAQRMVNNGTVAAIKQNAAPAAFATSVAGIGGSAAYNSLVTHPAEQAAKVAAEQAAKVAAEQAAKVAAEQAANLNVSMNQSMMAELDQVNAKLWAQTPVLDKAKYYVGAAWDGTVNGAKSAYSATVNGATATAAWAQKHPGYAVAAVAGIATAGYLGYKAYNYFTTPSESISSQDQAQSKALLNYHVEQQVKGGSVGNGYKFEFKKNVPVVQNSFSSRPTVYQGASKEALVAADKATTYARALNSHNMRRIELTAEQVTATTAALEIAKAEFKVAVAA